MNIPKLPLNFNEELSCEHKHNSITNSHFHCHDGYELFLLLNGDINYYIEQQGICLNRGSLVYLKPNLFHRPELKPAIPFERIVISIKDTYMDELCSDKADLSSCFYNLPSDRINSIQLDKEDLGYFTYLSQNLIKERHSSMFGNEILVESYIKQILVLANRLADNYTPAHIENIMPKLIMDTMAYIDTHITEDITLEAIANEIHHNANYLSRAFKKTLGLSPQQYIIKKRLTLAKHNLSQGYSLLDTCHLSGFNDYSNFSRTFTKNVGMSPKKYQLQKQNNSIHHFSGTLKKQ